MAVASESPGTSRATCWALTLWGPEGITDDAFPSWAEGYMKRQLPSGWKIEGQIERCPETKRLHIQACLKTPQVRFSAVQPLFPRSDIKPARNANALQRYVHKEDTRVQELDSHQEMTIWAFSETVASKWDSESFHERTKDISFEDLIKGKKNEVVLDYVDEIVADLIVSGVRGAEFMGVNPMFRSAWKRYYKAIIARETKKREYPRVELSEIFSDA